MHCYRQDPNIQVYKRLKSTGSSFEMVLPNTVSHACIGACLQHSHVRHITQTDHLSVHYEHRWGNNQISHMLFTLCLLGYWLLLLSCDWSNHVAEVKKDSTHTPFCYIWLFMMWSDPVNMGPTPVHELTHFMKNLQFLILTWQLTAFPTLEGTSKTDKNVGLTCRFQYHLQNSLHGWI